VLCHRAAIIREAMTELLIVDGNNVIGSRPDGWWRDRAAATRRLVEQLGAWTDQSVTVVFDGRRPDGLDAPERVEVIFAELSGRDAADDVIADLVARSKGVRIRVVTSDAGLAARVRVHGAEVLGSRAFRDELEG
jgi:predicted RNA-binding protein with PIN domain